MIMVNSVVAAVQAPKGGAAISTGDLLIELE